MVGKIDLIFIVLTPFHYKAFYVKYGSRINSKNVLILKDHNIDDSLFKDVESAVITIPNLKYSYFELKRNTFKSILEFRGHTKKLTNFCKRLFTTFNLDEKIVINIGTDKDIFTQIFLKEIYKLENISPFLIAFEEGLGFYVTNDFASKTKKIIYPLLSPLLFGIKIRYYRPMGQDFRIKKIYCRYPEYISKNKKMLYEKFEVRENVNSGSYNKSSDKVLIFSFPNQDLNIDHTVKLKWISQIYNIVNAKELHIKLHPAEKWIESEDYLLTNKVSILTNFLIEDINYFEYKYIVNFNSSVILDILASGYPADKIITIDLGAKLSASSIYDKTIMINPKNLKNVNQIKL